MSPFWAPNNNRNRSFNGAYQVLEVSGKSCFTEFRSMIDQKAFILKQMGLIQRAQYIRFKINLR